ncbi:MAG: hypothetical protein QOJ95_714 [Mycobacterium sp.]|nr:hypothetical protein [Mycobacterium sp.]
MGAARYIGRVGSLAVALGVGTAIATGYGVAAADETSTGSASSSSSSSSSTASTGNTGPDTDPAPKAPTAGTEPAVAEPTATPVTTGDKPAASSTTSTSSTLADGVVVSAQTNTGSSTPKPTTEPDPDVVVTVPEVTVPEVTVPEVTVPEPSTPKPSTPEASTPEPDQATAVVPTPANKPKPNGTTPTTAPTPSPATAAASSNEAPKTQSAAKAVAPASVLAVVSVAANSATTTQVATIDVTPPVPAPAPVAPLNPLEMVGNVVSSVVNWVLSPLLGNPATPAEPPLAWSLLAFARREFDNFVNAVTGRVTETPAVAVEPTSLALAAATTAFAQAAVTAVNVPAFPLAGAQLSPSTQFVQWLTGNYQTGNPLIADTLNRFGINGTDVGVIWDNGMVDDPSTPYNEHQVLMAFGDTFSGANMTGNWRFNVLLRSADTVLSDGVTIPNGEWFNGNMFGGTPLSSPTTARQIIHPDGLPAGITLIPTAGISLPTPGTQFGVTQYVNFMSVTNWGAPGTWTTNYSAFAYSTDNGENWTVAPTSVRYNDPWSGNANFQQGAYVRPGDGYVYNYGTPNGRQGYAYVSRVAEKDILDTSKYEYYSAGSAGGWFGWGATPSGWYKNQPAKASAVFGQDTGACGVANPGNQVSEMSVQYNKQLKKYVVLYGDQFNNIVMRTSDTPQGGWSAAKVLMGQQPGGIYAPMMHPWSPSTMGTGTDLYWNLSLWSQYNVMLMKTDLTKV